MVTLPETVQPSDVTAVHESEPHTVSPTCTVSEASHAAKLVPVTVTRLPPVAGPFEDWRLLVNTGLSYVNARERQPNTPPTAAVIAKLAG